SLSALCHQGVRCSRRIGRKTGKPRRTPVGDVLAGSFGSWPSTARRRDMSATLTAIRGLRLKLREGFRTVLILWYGAFDDDPRERQRWLAGQVPSSAANVAAVRLFGTNLLTVRIDLHA